jgi:hypothetical protein
LAPERDNNIADRLSLDEIQKGAKRRWQMLAAWIIQKRSPDLMVWQRKIEGRCSPVTARTPHPRAGAGEDGRGRFQPAMT